MTSHNSRFVIIFNGEIYNHLSIRSILEREFKIKWRGTSDTETLLESIAYFGIKKILEIINGMFAFALFDRLENKLLLSRDKLIEKTLYYGFK